MDMQKMQVDIIVYVCIIFQTSNQLSYFRIQQMKLSFIHIRIRREKYSIVLQTHIVIVGQVRILVFLFRYVLLDNLQTVR